jgi:protein-L-isoaspartate(D-aspartate) O-methyltransferase
VVLRAVLASAEAASRQSGPANYGDHGETPVKSLSEKHFAVLRRHMVEVVEIQVDLMGEELEKAALDERVLTAMRRVPRHLFVPEQLAALAYQDTPLPIGFDKTISQPFINAVMTDLLDLEPDDVVLEIGTGLGYQASILAQIVSQVWSVEIVEEFVSQAELRLHQLGYARVGIRVGDGSRGWVEHAPFDKILVTAAAEQPPPALLDQLKPGGRIVMPMGGADAQELTIIYKHTDGQTRIRQLIPVRFTRLETVI